MPSNSKTVVMQENTISNNKSIQILKKPDIGENCRFAGVHSSQKMFTQTYQLLSLFNNIHY